MSHTVMKVLERVCAAETFLPGVSAGLCGIRKLERFSSIKCESRRIPSSEMSCVHVEDFAKNFSCFRCAGAVGGGTATERENISEINFDDSFYI